MAVVSVVVDDIYQSTEISEESYEILQDAALLLNKPKKWFLVETVKMSGVLTEINIIKFIRSATRDYSSE